MLVAGLKVSVIGSSRKYPCMGKMQGRAFRKPGLAVIVRQFFLLPFSGIGLPWPAVGCESVCRSGLRGLPARNSADHLRGSHEGCAGSSALRASSSEVPSASATPLPYAGAA